MLCIDLCSGLGGFSEAFLDRGHDVVRIDNDSRFKDIPNTIIADIRNLSEIYIDTENGKNHLDCKKPDILLMSPPCNKFSIARVFDNWDKGIPKNDEVIQHLRIVFWCLDAVDYLKPKYWILENPRGMLRRVLNKPSIVIPGVTTYYAAFGTPYLKPTDLWGKLPPMDWPEPKKWEKASRNSHNKGLQNLRHFKKPFGNIYRRSELRAKVPYELSKALCLAVERSS